MTNDSHHLPRGRFQVPFVVLPLLALLLVFLSSITLQQISATQVNHGFIKTLDHLVVANHNGSIRVLSNKPKHDATADGDPDLSDWWRDNLIVLWDGLCLNSCIITAGTVYTPASPRFLIPVLRAPPLV